MPSCSKPISCLKYTLAICLFTGLVAGVVAIFFGLQLRYPKSSVQGPTWSLSYFKASMISRPEMHVDQLSGVAASGAWACVTGAVSGGLVTASGFFALHRQDLRAAVVAGLVNVGGIAACLYEGSLLLPLRAYFNMTGIIDLAPLATEELGMRFPTRNRTTVKFMYTWIWEMLQMSEKCCGLDDYRYWFDASRLRGVNRYFHCPQIAYYWSPHKPEFDRLTCCIHPACCTQGRSTLEVNPFVGECLLRACDQYNLLRRERITLNQTSMPQVFQTGCRDKILSMFYGQPVFSFFIKTTHLIPVMLALAGLTLLVSLTYWIVIVCSQRYAIVEENDIWLKPTSEEVQRLNEIGRAAKERARVGLRTTSSTPQNDLASVAASTQPESPKSSDYTVSAFVFDAISGETNYTDSAQVEHKTAPEYAQIRKPKAPDSPQYATIVKR